MAFHRKILSPRVVLHHHVGISPDSPGFSKDPWGVDAVVIILIIMVRVCVLGGFGFWGLGLGFGVSGLEFSIHNDHNSCI